MMRLSSGSIRYTGPMLAAIGAGVALVIVAGSLARPLVDAVLVSSAAGASDMAIASANDAFERDMTRARAQVDGRSMFFRPPAPPPPPPPVREREPEPDPGPPPRPTRYGGPEIIAMIDNHVWFKDGRVLEVGGDDSRGLRVVSATPPWSARVEWEDVEFDVELFKRTTERYLDPLEGATDTPATTPADEAQPPGENAADDPAAEQDLQEESAADDAPADEDQESGS